MAKYRGKYLKCRQCKHAEEVMMYIVQTKQSCPKHVNFGGTLAVDKPTCERCEHFEQREVSMMSKPDTSKVIPTMARQALKLAGGDRKAAFSRYIDIHYRNTGRLAPGCDNRDLQAFYDNDVERKI